MDWGDFRSVCCIIVDLCDADARVCSGEPIANLVNRMVSLHNYKELRNIRRALFWYTYKKEKGDAERPAPEGSELPPPAEIAANAVHVRKVLAVFSEHEDSSTPSASTASASSTVQLCVYGLR
jgi:hypothetical protein